MSNSVFALQVSPSIPPSLQRLDDLAKNFWFSWNPALGQLFRKLDPVLWRKVEGSPRLFLRSVDQSILDHAATDAELHRRVSADRRGVRRLPRRQAGVRRKGSSGPTSSPTSAPSTAGTRASRSTPAAWACSPAITARRPAISKLPFVAVGLLVSARLLPLSASTGNGQQIPEYPPIDPRSAPLAFALNADGTEVRVSCPCAGSNRSACASGKPPSAASRCCCSIPTCPRTSPEDRLITGKLYGGSDELRQQQEAVLGIGGVRALRALGLEPTVWHINEGHAAFLVLERLREYTTGGLPFAAALEATAANTVFTTHTPVSAGHDVFPPDRVARQFASYPAELGISPEQLLELGRAPDRPDVFNMTRLALRGVGGRQRRQQDSRRGSRRGLCETNVARRAAGREPRRLRDERRARLDVPAPHVGEAVRSSTWARTGASA